MTHFLLKIRIPWASLFGTIPLFVHSGDDGVGTDSALLVLYSAQFNEPLLGGLSSARLCPKDMEAEETQAVWKSMARGIGQTWL